MSKGRCLRSERAPEYNLQQIGYDPLFKVVILYIGITLKTVGFGISIYCSFTVE